MCTSLSVYDHVNQSYVLSHGFFLPASILTSDVVYHSLSLPLPLFGGFVDHIYSYNLTVHVLTCVHQHDFY